MANCDWFQVQSSRFKVNGEFDELNELLITSELLELNDYDFFFLKDNIDNIDNSRQRLRLALGAGAGQLLANYANWGGSRLMVNDER